MFVVAGLLQSCLPAGLVCPTALTNSPEAVSSESRPAADVPTYAHSDLGNVLGHHKPSRLKPQPRQPRCDALETECLPRQQPSYPRQTNANPLLDCCAGRPEDRKVVMPPSVSVLRAVLRSQSQSQSQSQSSALQSWSQLAFAPAQRATASTRSGSASARAGYDAAPSEPLHCGDEPRMTGMGHRIFMERVDMLCRKGWQGLRSNAVSVASTASGGVSTPER